mmetsp:Transcript_61492/g.194633  ORF Transcript_61492/g.194633 Transcript_61492/m.194633 type:complete len:225 (+) Transcript_61492:851-1525(+)
MHQRARGAAEEPGAHQRALHGASRIGGQEVGWRSRQTRGCPRVPPSEGRCGGQVAGHGSGPAYGSRGPGITRKGSWRVPLLRLSKGLSPRGPGSPPLSVTGAQGHSRCPRDPTPRQRGNRGRGAQPRGLYRQRAQRCCLWGAARCRPVSAAGLLWEVQGSPWSSKQAEYSTDASTREVAAQGGGGGATPTRSVRTRRGYAYCERFRLLHWDRQREPFLYREVGV